MPVMIPSGPAADRSRRPHGPLHVSLIGFGAIGSAVFDALSTDPAIVFDRIVVSARSAAIVQQRVGPGIPVVSCIDMRQSQSSLVLECAGHVAIGERVIPLLRAGTECAIVSTGALADNELRAAFDDAAADGGVRPILLCGAVGGLDALSAAVEGGLDEVLYVGRKPVEGWRNTPADARGILRDLKTAVTIFDGTASDAARQYPKNANVAASVALAGVGFERTQVRLVADPAATRNTHTLYARGAFGELNIEIAASPSERNPKTSALTAYGAIGFLRRRAISG